MNLEEALFAIEVSAYKDLCMIVDYLGLKERITKEMRRQLRRNDRKLNPTALDEFSRWLNSYTLEELSKL